MFTNVFYGEEIISCNEIQTGKMIICVIMRVVGRIMSPDE